ncbi:MAG: hypothetical protein ACOYOE_07885 [Chlorobium sp.]
MQKKLKRIKVVFISPLLTVIGNYHFVTHHKSKNTEALWGDIPKIAAKNTIISVLSPQPMIALPIRAGLTFFAAYPAGEARANKTAVTIQIFCFIITQY